MTGIKHCPIKLSLHCKVTVFVKINAQFPHHIGGHLRQQTTKTHSQYTSFDQNCLQTVSGQTLFSSLNDVVLLSLMGKCCTIRSKM